MNAVPEPLRSQLDEAFAEWRQQQMAFDTTVTLDATIMGDKDRLRSVISKLRSEIADPDAEDGNVIGGFIYPRFTVDSDAGATLGLLDKVYGVCSTDEVELIDVDISLPDSDGDAFLCLGGLLSNAQTH